MKTLICDIDDTTLDWSESYTKYSGFERDPSGVWLPEAYSRGKEFNLSSEFGVLNPIRNSKQVLNDFYLAGWDIIAVTSCGTNPITRQHRTNNLHQVFGRYTFKDIITLDHSEDKMQIFSTLKHQFGYDKCVLVEDSLQNISHGLHMGWKCYLINHPHNQPNPKAEWHSDITFVDMWDEIREQELEEFRK